MSRTKFIILFITYAIILSFLTLYSYSQIDLNLTLSSNALYQAFQKQLIYLGYFNRPGSTIIYLTVLFLLFAFYFLILSLVSKKKLSLYRAFCLIMVSVVILFFTYPAFSHDFFNYMFDARIVTKYHLNPYFYKALDFPSDLWIRFMHWTHRTYPYGPVWLVITTPFSFLGLERFTLTLLNFKLMFALFHLGNIYLIYKILASVANKSAILGTIFYALNPLVLIESLVSPHNEVMMLFFLLISFYTGFIKQNFLLGVTGLLISAGVKFITIVFLPLFILLKIVKNKHNFTSKVVVWLLFFLCPPLILEIIHREPYPWYFILLVGIGALGVNNGRIRIFILGVCIGALLRYVPYLFYGSYTSWVAMMQTWLFLIPIAASTIWIGLGLLGRRSFR